MSRPPSTNQATISLLACVQALRHSVLKSIFSTQTPHAVRQLQGAFQARTGDPITVDIRDRNVQVQILTIWSLKHGHARATHRLRLKMYGRAAVN